MQEDQNQNAYYRSDNESVEYDFNIFGVLNNDFENSANFLDDQARQNNQMSLHRDPVLIVPSEQSQYQVVPLPTTPIFIGSFATYSMANNCVIKSRYQQLEVQSRHYFYGKEPIKLTQKGPLYSKNTLDFINSVQMLQKVQVNLGLLQSMNYPMFNMKSKQISFSPMFVNCWKLLIPSTDVKVSFFANLPQNYEYGSLLVPLKIDLEIKQSLLNQHSKLLGKGYVELIKQYQILKKAKNQVKNIKLKLQNHPINGINYKGNKYFNNSQFQPIYSFHTDAFSNFKRSQVEEAKVARLFLLHLMEQLKVKVIHRSFIKPRKRMSYFVNWFINKTIGHKLSNTKKYRSIIKSFLVCDPLSLLIDNQDHYQNYYKDQSKIDQINQKEKQQKIETKQSLKFKSQSEMQEQKSEVYQQSEIVKNWLKYQRQSLQFSKAQKQKFEMISIAYPEQQNLTTQLYSKRKEMEDKILNQLGLAKGEKQVSNKEIQEQNAKLAEQFQRQNKYFRIHPTPESMINKLHDYQGQALQWMKYRQGKISVTQLFQQTYLDEKEQNFQYQRSLSPFWSEVEFINGERMFVNYVTGEFTRIFHPWKSIKGGILADQMGLGKTVMAISLLADDQFQGTTLIVVPVNVIRQWGTQFKKHCKRDLKIFEYHQDQNKRSVDLLKYDIVITTYGTLGNQQKAYNSIQQGQPNKAGQKFLFNYKFRRVILDQAQNIKCPSTLQFEGANRLQSEFKWCLTGTIVQNTQQDLFAIFKFLDVEVFSEQYWWNTYIKRCDNQAEKFNILHTALRPIMLRRTKQSTNLNGRVILKLPERKQFVIKPEFTQEEARVYTQLQKGIKVHLAQLSLQSSTSFTHIFQILSRLRQFCCHPSLIFKKRLQDIGQGDIKQFLQKFIKTGSQQFKMQAIEKILEEQNDVCPICQEDPREEAVITTCGHIYCESCLKSLFSLAGRQKCAICRIHFTGQYFRRSKKKNEQKEIVNSMIDSDSSKLKAVVQCMQKIVQRKQKCVIFSQWVKVIQILKKKMNQRGMKWASITGNMNKVARAKNVKIFQDSQDCSFMIVSLRAGGTGLNLTMANNVMVCDPWWNPAHQDQAIHRVHRIGQEKTVNVYRFFVKNSIEQKIQQMHQRKRKLAERVMMKNSRQSQKQQKATQEMIRMIVS